jgi:hypothetical protein
MFTRGHVAPSYSAVKPERVGYKGFVKVVQKDDILQTWAIARPCFGWASDGAPYYLGTPANQKAPRNKVLRGGVETLRPAKPNIEMDPSDATTWRRPYRFT